jgi:hypothetical protein
MLNLVARIVTTGQLMVKQHAMKLRFLASLPDSGQQFDALPGRFQSGEISFCTQALGKVQMYTVWRRSDGKNPSVKLRIVPRSYIYTHIYIYIRMYIIISEVFTRQ